MKNEHDELIERILSRLKTIPSDDDTSIEAALREELNHYVVQKVVLEGPGRLLDAFLLAKRVEGRSERTIKQYENTIRNVETKIGLPAECLSVLDIRNYFSCLQLQGVSNRSVENKRRVLSSFYGWLKKEDLIRVNPMSKISSIKYQAITRFPYSSEDIEKLKEACETSRDRVIIDFLLSTGCRVDELCKVDISNINFRQKECLILGKGNKERVVFLDDVTIMMINRYLGERSNKHGALFVGQGSERLTSRSIESILTKIAERANVSNVHPHRFRRTFATNLINRGMPIQQVSLLLGHESINTTMTYVYVDKNDVANAYRKYM